MLLDFLRLHPEAAAAGPRLFNPDGTLQRNGGPFPCLSGVPGAIREIAVRMLGSMRGSSSAALRGKPSGAVGRRSCLFVLGSVAIEPRPYRPAQSLRFENA